jgi:hypothetical protein
MTDATAGSPLKKFRRLAPVRDSRGRIAGYCPSGASCASVGEPHVQGVRGARRLRPRPRSSAPGALGRDGWTAPWRTPRTIERWPGLQHDALTGGNPPQAFPLEWERLGGFLSPGFNPLVPGHTLEANVDIGYPMDRNVVRRRETIRPVLPQAHPQGRCGFLRCGSLETWCCRLGGEGPPVKHQPQRREKTKNPSGFLGLDEALDAQLLAGGVCPEAAGL